jgi:hypothetical protein
MPREMTALERWYRSNRPALITIAVAVLGAVEAQLQEKHFDWRWVVSAGMAALLGIMHSATGPSPSQVQAPAKQSP